MVIPTHLALQFSQQAKHLTDIVIPSRLRRLGDMELKYPFHMTPAEVDELHVLSQKFADQIVAVLSTATMDDLARLQATFDSIEREMARGDAILDRMEKTLSQRAMKNP